MGKLTLKPEQDGMGFWYGNYIADDGTHVRVDVLPPKSLPRPHFVLCNDHIHDTDWLVHANGPESLASNDARISTVLISTGSSRPPGPVHERRALVSRVRGSFCSVALIVPQCRADLH